MARKVTAPAAAKEPAADPTKPTTAAQRSRIVSTLITALNKRYLKNGGAGAALIRGCDLKSPERIPTGSLSFDWITGGGPPRGNFSLLWGEEGVGKTSMCLALIAWAQKLDPNFTVLWLDGSLRFESMRGYANSLGVDLNRFYVVQAPVVEMAVQVMKDVVAAGAVDLVIVDDLAVYSTVIEMFKKSKTDDQGTQQMGEERGISEQSVAAQARANAMFIRKTCHTLKVNNVCCIFTQQVRSNMDNRGGKGPEFTMPGGHALRHILVLSLFMRAASNTFAPTVDSTEAGRRIGFPINFRISKMSIDGAQPKGTAIGLQWIFGKGFEPGRDAFWFLEQRGLVKKDRGKRCPTPELTAMVSDIPESFPGRRAMEAWLAEHYHQVYTAFVPNLDLQIKSRRREALMSEERLIEIAEAAKTVRLEDLPDELEEIEGAAEPEEEEEEGDESQPDRE